MSKTLVAVTVIFAALYVFECVLFLSSFLSPSLHSSTRTFFLGLFAMTAILFVIAWVQAIVYRKRAGALLPVLLASIFGSFVLEFGRSIY